MTNTELYKEINCLKTKLAELEEKVDALPNEDGSGGAFKPEYGQEYWYIMHAGGVTSSWCNDCTFDQHRYAIGNCYSTRQSAEDAIRVLKLIQKAKESQDGYVPDWKDLTQHKYFLDFHSGDIGISDYLSINVAPIFGYWEDESVCEQFVQDNHDELLWFFTEYRR